MDFLCVLTEVILLLGCLPILGSSVDTTGPSEAIVKSNHVLRPTKTSVEIHGFASDNASSIKSRRPAMSTADSPELGKYILLFGAFCNGEPNDAGP